MDYAIIKTGGKQYLVQSGDVIDVERLVVEPGESIELNDVRMIAQDENVIIGNPTVEGARVVAEADSQFRGPKLIVFKYKAKKRYRRKTGHRQEYTRLTIREILYPTNSAPEPENVSIPSERKVRSRPKKDTADTPA